MTRPPGTRYRTGPQEPTWRSILAAYAVAAAIPALFWLVSYPLAGVAAIAAIVALRAGARRTAGLVRCFRECRGIAFDLGGRVRITVTNPSVDDPC